MTASGAAVTPELERDIRDGAREWRKSPPQARPMVQGAMESRLVESGFLGLDAKALVEAAIADRALPPTWSTPVSFEQTPRLPDPDLSGLPAWLKNMTCEIARAFQVPAAFPAFYALALVGACVAGKFRVVVRSGWAMPLVLYVLVAMRSGERKSPPIAQLTAPLRDFEARVIADIEEARRVAKGKAEVAKEVAQHARKMAARAAAKHDADAESLRQRAEDATLEATRLEEAIPPARRLMTEYATPEALHQRMASNYGRQVIVSDEGAGVFAMTRRYSKDQKPNLDLFLKGYDRVPFTPALATRELTPLRSCELSIALGLQPAVIRDLGDVPEFKERGAIARFLSVVPTSLVGSRATKVEPVSESTAADYATKMTRLLEIEDRIDDGWTVPRDLTLSEAADAAILGFQDWLEPQLAEFGAMDRIDLWAEKLAGNAGRLAAILHVARHAGRAIPSVVEEVDATSAITLVRSLIPHAHAVADLLEEPVETVNARKVLRWLRRHCGKLETGSAPVRFRRRDVHQALRGAKSFRQGDALDEPLRVLEQRGFIRPTEEPRKKGPGRPPELYDVNPLWLTSLRDEAPAASSEEDVA